MKPWEMYQNNNAVTESVQQPVVQPKPWERFQSTQKEQVPERGLATGTAHAVANGALFGAGDEVLSAMKTISDDAVKNKGRWQVPRTKEEYDTWLNNYNKDYSKNLETERAVQKKFDREHPVLSIGGNIAGAIMNPLSRAVPVTNGTVLGSQTLAKSLAGAATGGVYGGLYGLGEGEGGLVNRLRNARKNATTGAIVGGSVPLVVEGVKAVGRGVADIAGQTSGAGGESLKRAYDAGTRNSATFKDAMRGNSGVYDVVDDVDNAVRTMERNASAKYKSMLPDNGATLKLPDTEFKSALKKATESISGVTAGVDDTAADAVNKVHKLAQNIKVSGGMTFDNALEAKKAIDGIIEPLARKGEKNAVRLLTPIKQALNSTLETAVPEYGGARAAFRADTKLIDSIKSALTSKDPTTELRKLQGITRQSVAAAQGGKQELGKLLDNVSGGKILDAIAGGQVQQLTPRDPLRFAGAIGTALGTHALSASPVGVAVLPAFSPRVSGELAYKLGQIAGKLPQTNTNAAVRLIEMLQKR